jgi:hypothetical protein
MPLMIDKSRLGPFVLEQRLGRQKTGSVYHAVHLQRRRAMAIRIMSQHLGNSGTSVQEFAREVEFLKTLEHPNVVRVHGGGVFDDEAYIATELVKGESLDEVLTYSLRLPWQTVIDYASQVCAGLEYAHQRGTYHQNLSTAKILVTEEGRIKITDFRGNRLNHYDRWDAQPHVSSVAYMAPEQLRGETNITQKVDLYSLGCVMYELLTGRLPFDGQTALEVREKHLQQPPPRVSSLVFDCPIMLDGLVAQLLEKEPNKRPHYASQVGVALQEVRENENAGIVEHAVSGASALRAQVGDTAIKRLLGRKSSSRRQAQWVPFYERVWFLAGCAALVIGLCTWAFWPASEEQLFANAEKLMASGDRVQWQQARESYLEPLLKRFPDGQYATQARQYIEQIDMKNAQARVELNLRLGRRGKTEGERRYATAWELEQDGELADALAAYEEVLEKVEAKNGDAVFVKLAQQQIDKLRPAVALAAAAEKQATEDAAAAAVPAENSAPLQTPLTLPGTVDRFPAGHAVPISSPPREQPRS